MQRAETEELRQREANMTALRAIGTRKKPKLDLPGSTGSYNQVSITFQLDLFIGLPVTRLVSKSCRLNHIRWHTTSGWIS